MHSFADGNSCPCFVKFILKLIAFLESECEVDLNCFNENKMIINLGKCYAIVIDKAKQDFVNDIIFSKFFLNFSNFFLNVCR